MKVKKEENFLKSVELESVLCELFKLKNIGIGTVPLHSCSEPVAQIIGFPTMLQLN